MSRPPRSSFTQTVHSTIRSGADEIHFCPCASFEICLISRRSVITPNIHGCSLPPEGERRAASSISWITSLGTGRCWNLRTLTRCLSNDEINLSSPLPGCLHYDNEKTIEVSVGDICLFMPPVPGQ